MAVDFTPTDVGGGFNRADFNNNFAALVTALQDALSRSGNGPNQMTADLDLNGFNLLNAANVDTGGSNVQSVFGRTGNVAAQNGDYNTDQITEGVNRFVSPAQEAKIDSVEVGANLYVHPNHSGDVVSTGDGATTIQVDTVSNDKLANMGSNTIKGRQASPGDPQDLSAAAVRTIIESLPMETLTQAAYDALTPEAGRLYFIVG